MAKYCPTCDTTKDIMRFYSLHDNDDRFQVSCFACRAQGKDAYKVERGEDVDSLTEEGTVDDQSRAKVRGVGVRNVHQNVRETKRRWNRGDFRGNRGTHS